MRKKPPEVHIPKKIWQEILNEAKQFTGKDGEEKAYALIAKRRGGKVPKGYFGNHYKIIEKKPIELEHNPEKPSIYRYIQQKKRGMYFTKEKKYVGAVEIRNNTDLCPMDGYWFGIERIDINIYVNAKGESRGFWVDHQWGRFYEIRPTIKS